MAYILDMTVAHRLSLLGLVNEDNAATIGTPLTLVNTNIKNARVVDQVSEDVARGHAVTLENAAYPADFVEVYFNKIQMADVVEMVISDTAASDFDWYAPDNWDAETSPADAIEAFELAAARAGVGPAAYQDIAVTRRFDGTENAYYLDFTFTSLVFEEAVSYRMPKFFSEDITVTNLNGFVFTPIAAEDVVF